MTETELKAKWTETQFNEWQRRGIIHSSISYAEYLEMRREQEELREQQLQEILADYGTWPNEEPPEMDEEALADLERARQAVTQEKSREKKLSEFFAESPLVGVELDLTRDSRS